MCDALILAEQSCRSRHHLELEHTHIAPCQRILQKSNDEGFRDTTFVLRPGTRQTTIGLTAADNVD